MGTTKYKSDMTVKWNYSPFLFPTFHRHLLTLIFQFMHSDMGFGGGYTCRTLLSKYYFSYSKFLYNFKKPGPLMTSFLLITIISILLFSMHLSTLGTIPSWSCLQNSIRHACCTHCGDIPVGWSQSTGMKVIESLNTMHRRLVFLTSIPEAAIEQAVTNEDARMHSVSEMLKSSIEHSVWHKTGDQFMFAGSMNE